MRKATETKTFSYRREEGQNPFTGFMSFQHFRGEKLYSDIVVLPENNYCETEAVECYPVPSDVPENGREEGYYPDTSIVYIRILWKEFEPERGVYNYKFIEDILEEARQHNQSLIFRLMAHSTRARDDVPEWLKSMIPCPERPDGMRVKDSPTAPEFLEYFSEAVRKFGERFDSDPTLYMVDISLPGAWGEGHNLHLYSQESLEKLVKTYTDVFKETQLVGQISRPDLLRSLNEITTVGWRGDGLGEPRHLNEFYPPNIEKIPDLWKTAPVSFEAYWWLGEWQRKGWDLDSIIEKTLEWHISSFNAKSIPVPYEWKDKIDAWVSKMGYHFAIDAVKYPEKVSGGDAAEFVISIDNCGVAPIYKEIPCLLKLKNEQGEYVMDTGINIRTWFPGKHENQITVTVPSEISQGEYMLEIGVLNENVPMLYFCTDAERDGSFYKIGKITVE